MKLHEIKGKDDLGMKLNLWEKDLLDRCVRYDDADRETNGHHAYLDRDDEGLRETFAPLDGLGPRKVLDGIIQRQGHATILDFGRTTGTQLFSLLNQSHSAYHPGTDIELVTADIISDKELFHLSDPWRSRAAILGGIINYEVIPNLDSVSPDGPVPAASYDLITAFDAIAGSNSAAAVVQGLARALRPEGTLYFNMVKGREDNVREAVAELRDNRYTVISLAEQAPVWPCHLTTWPEEWNLPVPYKVTAPAA